MVIQVLALKMKGESIGVSFPLSTGIWVLSWGWVVQAGARVSAGSCFRKDTPYPLDQGGTRVANRLEVPKEGVPVIPAVQCSEPSVPHLQPRLYHPSTRTSH